MAMEHLQLARLNGITSTIVACLGCHMTPERIAAKLEAKYGLSGTVAAELVAAVAALVASEGWL